MKKLYSFIIALVLSMSFAFASELPLGKFETYEYAYIPEATQTKDSFVTVLIISREQAFNLNKDPEFAFAGEVFAINCETAEAAVLERVLVHKDGQIAMDRVVPDDKIKFIPIVRHSVAGAAFLALCTKHPTI
jgi:hypothetical protein